MELSNDQRTAIRQSCEQMPKDTVITVLLEEIEYKRLCEDRIKALKAALSKNWAHNGSGQTVYCGVCLGLGDDEENVRHKPDCIVLTLPQYDEEKTT